MLNVKPQNVRNVRKNVRNCFSSSLGKVFLLKSCLV
ncbi:hypothetical protein SK68_05249 [Serratia marcescens]|nr:hypothetical protein SK68_05249 [Serratia marcescens]KMJ02697.1 hypothetical protein SN03_05172 [Serratia marcescens]